MCWSRGGEPVGEWSLPSCLAVRAGGVAAGESPIRSRPSFRTSCESATSLGSGDRSLRCTGRSCGTADCGVLLLGLAGRCSGASPSSTHGRPRSLGRGQSRHERCAPRAQPRGRCPLYRLRLADPPPAVNLESVRRFDPAADRVALARGSLREELFELLLAAGVDQDEASIGAGHRGGHGRRAHVQHYQPDPAGSPRRNAGGRGDAVPAGPGARQLRPDPQPPRRSGRGRVDRRRRTGWDDPELIHRPRLIARRLHTRITGPAQG